MAAESPVVAAWAAAAWAVESPVVAWARGRAGTEGAMAAVRQEARQEAAAAWAAEAAVVAAWAAEAAAAASWAAEATARWRAAAAPVAG